MDDSQPPASRSPLKRIVEDVAIFCVGGIVSAAIGTAGVEGVLLDPDLSVGDFVARPLAGALFFSCGGVGALLTIRFGWWGDL